MNRQRTPIFDILVLGGCFFMAKLYFRHGAMNCGKSAALMQVAHNYNENDMGVIVIKSSTDTKADDHLQSRTGLTRKVDYLLNPKESIEPHFEKWAESAKCILVDEAQFLSPEQVNELWIFSKIYDRPVICYGLRTDFQSNLFEGSKRLLEVADEIEELTTICRCGNKAQDISDKKECLKVLYSFFNARKNLLEN